MAKDIQLVQAQAAMRFRRAEMPAILHRQTAPASISGFPAKLVFGLAAAWGVLRESARLAGGIPAAAGRAFTMAYVDPFTSDRGRPGDRLDDY